MTVEKEAIIQLEMNGKHIRFVLMTLTNKQT